MNLESLKSLLDEKVDKYNISSFLLEDPIQIPHLFSKKEEIEIAGFLTSIISWGKRPMIIRNAKKMMQLIDNDPYNFIKGATENDLKKIQGSIHRTFQDIDLVFFIKALQNIYQNGGLEKLFVENQNGINQKDGIIALKNEFLKTEHELRSEKHLADPSKNSAAKRINMSLKWMVRNDSSSVDFGIWKESISSAHLSIPLDVHVGNIARPLGLLTRTQNDWKSVEELDGYLRMMDPIDPVKYDYALFSMGIKKDI